MAARRVSTREITKHLREIANEVEDRLTVMGPDGEVTHYTKAEAMARIVWLNAIGGKQVEYRETGKGEDRKIIEIEVAYQPKQWAIQLIFDRLEGRIPDAIGETQQGVTVADKVTELGKSKLNAVAAAMVDEKDEESDAESA